VEIIKLGWVHIRRQACREINTWTTETVVDRWPSIGQPFWTR